MTDQNQDNPDVKVTSVAGGHKETMENPAPAPADDGKPQMPEGGHEKYWDADKGVYNWEAHHKEHVWQQQQKSAKEPAKSGDESGDKAAASDTSADKTPANEADDAAAKAASEAGIDIDAFNAAIASGDEVPSDAYEKLAKVGVTKDMVDDYVELKRGQIAAHVEEVETFLGGAAGMAKLKEFVTKNFKPEEVQDFNNALNDPARWHSTAAYLLAQAGLPQGQKSRGTTISGPNAAPTTTAAAPYATDAELQRDIRDPRYRKDPTFREEVYARLRNSPNLNPAAGAPGHKGGL